MSSSDREPLLPTHSNSNSSKPHMNHSSSSRLSTTRISFPSSSTSALGPPDDDETLVSTSPNLRGKRRLSGGSPITRVDNQKRQGVPKLSRECLISEIKCYGSYMLPPLFVFGVLAIGISLLIYGKRNGWF